MFHRTLSSYWSNQPWDKHEEHPDGLLWLMTYKEFMDLPTGIEIHSISGHTAIKGKDDVDTPKFDNERIIWGLRGRRNGD